MFIVIIGGGRIGGQLAQQLVNSGHRVAVVEKNPARCEQLRKELAALVICGDGNDPAVLQEAGVRSADALVAATNEDEDNLVIALLGRREFAVRRIIARINHPKNAWLFTPTMGVDIAVQPAQVVAKLIEQEIIR